MGKGGAQKPQNYYGSIAGIVAAGPWDFLTSLIIDEKTVWPTDVGWADDIIGVPIVIVERRGSGVSRITTSVAHGLKRGDKFVATGIPSPYNTFNCATATSISKTIGDSTIEYTNA